jgi:hypothetical protein
MNSTVYLRRKMEIVGDCDDDLSAQRHREGLR